ncbi:Dbl homology domain-containing protein, partial [Blyttiomyces helicus]
VFVTGITTGGLVPPSKLPSLVKEVFSNYKQIRAVNGRLLERLRTRQRVSPVVDVIGDVFVEMADDFSKPYVGYAWCLPVAKLRLRHERKRNTRLARILTDMRRRPETRKLPIDSFLCAPTLRLGHYPLLLEMLFSETPKDHPDHIFIPQAVATFKEILNRVNTVIGKATDRLIWEQVVLNIDALGLL